MQNILKSNGWHISEPGWKKLKINESMKQSEVEKLLLDTDIKEYGAAHIDQNWAKSKEFFTDGVLQLQKIRNVTAPKINEESGGAPRLFKISLTDGVTTVVAVEWGHWHAVTSATAPGTKLAVTAPAPVCCGYVLLSDSGLRVLGGVVEALQEKWLLSKTFAGGQLRPVNNSNAPPAWVPFGTKSSANSAQPVKNFKSFTTDSASSSLSVAAGAGTAGTAAAAAGGGGCDSSHSADFSDQRSAHISRAKQNTSTNMKQFANSGVKDIAIVNRSRDTGGGQCGVARADTTPRDSGRYSPPAHQQRDSRGARRGGRGGGRRRERHDRYDPEEAELIDRYTRPVRPATLLDFVNLHVTGLDYERNDADEVSATQFADLPSANSASYHSSDTHSDNTRVFNDRSRDIRSDRNERSRGGGGRGRGRGHWDRQSASGGSGRASAVNSDCADGSISGFVQGARARRRQTAAAAAVAFRAGHASYRSDRGGGLGDSRGAALASSEAFSRHVPRDPEHFPPPSSYESGSHHRFGSGGYSAANDDNEFHFSGSLVFCRGGGGRARRRRARGH